MTEKNLTEAEIMKALECCKSRETGKCDRCILSLQGRECKNLTFFILDLINRKNAEIEEYKERFEMLDSNSQMAIGYADALEERAKAEAIKEFAERVSKELKIDKFFLDQIAKEMGVR